MTKAGKKSGGGSKGKAAAGPRAPAQQVSAADLYMQAQIALQYDDIDGAKKALKLAVKLEPTNAALLDAYACLLAEVEDAGALVALQAAVEASPQSGHEKYMYLAQLEEDCDKALSYSNVGLGLLHQRLHAAQTAAAAAGAGTSSGAEDDEDVDEVTVLTQALSSALCTHAEMLLQKAVAERDMAAGASHQQEPERKLDPAVVQKVESMCAQSKELVATSPEPGQLLASLYSQAGREQEAIAALRASMTLWFKHAQDSDEERERGEAATEGASAMEEDEEEDEELPSQEFRVECVKLLLELDETTDAAVEVLETLIEEDDSNPHFWHLLGLAFYSGHHYEEALEAVGKSGTLMQQLRIPRSDEVWTEMEDLNSAIREAMGLRAAEAGASGKKV